jgi:hypothetical protein
MYVAASTDNRFSSSKSSDDEASGEELNNRFSELLSAARIDGGASSVEIRKLIILFLKIKNWEAID